MYSYVIKSNDTGSCGSLYGNKRRDFQILRQCILQANQNDLIMQRLQTSENLYETPCILLYKQFWLWSPAGHIGQRGHFVSERRSSLNGGFPSTRSYEESWEIQTYSCRVENTRILRCRVWHTIPVLLKWRGFTGRGLCAIGDSTSLPTGQSCNWSVLQWRPFPMWPCNRDLALDRIGQTPMWWTTFVVRCCEDTLVSI